MLVTIQVEKICSDIVDKQCSCDSQRARDSLGNQTFSPICERPLDPLLQIWTTASFVPEIFQSSRLILPILGNHSVDRKSRFGPPPKWRPKTESIRIHCNTKEPNVRQCHINHPLSRWGFRPSRFSLRQPSFSIHYQHPNICHRNTRPLLQPSVTINTYTCHPTPDFHPPKKEIFSIGYFTHGIPLLIASNWESHVIYSSTTFGTICVVANFANFRVHACDGCSSRQMGRKSRKMEEVASLFHHIASTCITNFCTKMWVLFTLSFFLIHCTSQGSHFVWHVSGAKSFCHFSLFQSVTCTIVVFIRHRYIEVVAVPFSHFVCLFLSVFTFLTRLSFSGLLSSGEVSLKLWIWALLVSAAACFRMNVARRGLWSGFHSWERTLTEQAAFLPQTLFFSSCANSRFAIVQGMVEPLTAWQWLWVKTLNLVKEAITVVGACELLSCWRTRFACLY